MCSSCGPAKVSLSIRYTRHRDAAEVADHVGQFHVPLREDLLHPLNAGCRGSQMLGALPPKRPEHAHFLSCCEDSRGQRLRARNLPGNYETERR
jgi:hypothetical protein